MSEIEVAELKRDQYEVWDNLVENSPYGTIFHKSTWLTICSEMLNQKLKILGCFEKNRLVGGCSLFTYTSKGLFKIASSICDMTPYGGIALLRSSSNKVGRREAKEREIIESIFNGFGAEQFDHIQLVNPPDFMDIRPFVWNGWDSRVYYAYYIDLEADIGLHP
jgi:hypothetical protein